MKDHSDFNAMKYSVPSAMSRHEDVRIRKVLQLIGSGKRVLDVGCYDGTISQAIKAAGNDVYGCETSPVAARMAREKGITVAECDLEAAEWPALGRRFDVIFAGEVIEHIFDTDAFLKKLYGLLEDGGSLILTTPNIASLGRRLLLLCGMNPLVETTARGDDAGHIRYFTMRSLVTLLEENGFAVRDTLSDVVTFARSGAVYCGFLAALFPSFGRTLIVRTVKK